MSRGGGSKAIRRLAALVGAGALMAVLGGCELTNSGNNVVNGKALFVQKCGACHTLDRAGTTGVSGPDLDAAFANARASGLKENTFEGVVYGQILHPNTSPQTDPATGKLLPSMPAKLVTGDDARDVAAYVAQAASKRGKDTGALANVGAKKAEGVAKAEGGTLEIPADPGGSLSYTFASAEAPAGALTIRSPNEASIPHNIALEGQGVNELGPIVQSGGVSEIQVQVQAGEYTFFCSVPGHRQGGMEGKLTVS